MLNSRYLPLILQRNASASDFVVMYCTHQPVEEVVLDENQSMFPPYSPIEKAISKFKLFSFLT